MRVGTQIQIYQYYFSLIITVVKTLNMKSKFLAPKFFWLFVTLRTFIWDTFPTLFILYFETESPYVARLNNLGLNLQSSCLSFPECWVCRLVSPTPATSSQSFKHTLLTIPCFTADHQSLFLELD